MSRKRAATTSRPCKVHGDGAERYKDGRCAECMRERVHAYHQEHREDVIAKAKTYYEANREAILAKQRAYREAHRDELRAYATAYRTANREEILAKQRQRRRGASSSSRTVEGSEFAVAAAARD